MRTKVGALNAYGPAALIVGEQALADADADHHTLIEPVARHAEHPPAVLLLPQGIGDGFTFLAGNEDAVASTADITLDGTILVEDVADQPGAA